MRKLLAFLVTGLIITGQAAGQFTEETTEDFQRTGTSSAVFLKLIPDARTAALGGAHAGIYGDVSSLYWNPAGIAAINGVGITFTTVNLFAGISYNFMGVTFPLGSGSTLGIQSTYLNSGEMEETTLAEPEGTGRTFNTASYAVGISYARYMTDHLMTGITVKYIREDIWLTKAQSFAFDLGTVLETGVMGMRLGMSLTNLGPNMSLSGDNLGVNTTRGRILIPADVATESWAIPVSFRVGLALDLLGPESPFGVSETNTLTMLADFNDNADTFSRGNFGLEYNWNQLISLRGGYYLNYDEVNLSYGAGLKYGGNAYDIIVDYAVVDFGRLELVNQFDISLLF